MPTESEKKRRAAIAYLLRRRKRGRKTGANSGQPVKSWAEYGEVNYTPSGSQLPGWRWLLPVSFPFIVLIPALIIANGQAAQDLYWVGLHPVAWTMLGVLALILIVIAVFFLAYAALSIWRIIRANLPHKKE